MADMPEATIHIESVGPRLDIEMARPELRNAFNPAMITELTAIFRSLAGDAPADDGDAEVARPRVVVLAGQGHIFSAGADLDWMRSMADYSFEENVADSRRLAGLFEAIRSCPLPVVARVQGAAMGGGSGLVAACDIAVAAEGTKFAFSEARLGIVPAVISPYVLPRIGQSAARELFLTGERFEAQKAREIGLVHQVVPLDALDAAIERRVKALLAAGPEAQAAIKRLIPFVGSTPDDEAALEFTSRMISERRASAEGQEGMAAFLERRRPNWHPRR